MRNKAAGLGARSTVTMAWLGAILLVCLLGSLEAAADSCLLALPSNCALGTFLLRDLQSNVLGGDCNCVPCLPGTFRNVASQDVCEIAGDYGFYAPLVSQGRSTRTNGMCTSFRYTGALSTLASVIASYAADQAQVSYLGSKIQVASYSSTLLSAYIWGNMKDLRNFQSTCGSLAFTPGNAKNLTVSMVATRPGTALHKFTLSNPGQLPVNFTYVPTSFAFVYTQSFSLVETVQVVGANSSAVYQVGFDTGAVPSQYEWTNKSGFSFAIPIVPFQYWEQASPRLYETIMFMVFHVTYTTSALILVPASVDFRLKTGETRNARVQLLNLSPVVAPYTASINYDSGGSAYLDAIPGGSLNGSTQCSANVPVAAPLSEFSKSIDINLNATQLLMGRYGATVSISGMGSTSTLRVSVEVEPGWVSPSGFFLSTGNSTFKAATFGEAYIIPTDSLGQVSFNFLDDPNTHTFQITLQPLFPCTTCNTSATAQYLSGVGYYFNLNFPRQGSYALVAVAGDGNPVKYSGTTLTVLPLDCSSNGERNSEYSETLNECACKAGYGEVLRESPFVLCEECAPGTFTSSSGFCEECPTGTYASLPRSSECRECRANDPDIMAVPSKALRPLQVGDSIELEREAFDSLPNAARDACEKCPPNNLVRADLNVCLPCHPDRKTRKVVQEIVGQNGTFTMVRWNYACVCRANFYTDALNDTCVPCPSGGFCLGKTKETILPLEGFWKNPWAPEGTRLERCRIESSCPGVFLDPQVLQQTDAYLYERELAYAETLNSTLASIHQQHGQCQVNFLCAEGFAGPLCSKCDTSYTRLGTNECTKCIPQAAMVMVIIIGISCALILTAFIVRRTITTAKEEMEVWGSSRILGASQNAPSEGFRDSSAKGGGSYRESQASTRGNSEVIMSKILISHLQEVSISVAFQLAWPLWVAQMFDVFNILSSAGQTLFSLSCLLNPSRSGENGMDVGGACLANHSVADTGVFDNTRPLTFFIEAIFISAIPFVWALCAAAFWYFFYWRRRIVHNERKGRSAWNFFLLTLMVLVFLLYPTLSRTALKFFSCSTDFAGYRFLEADFNVVCFGPTHNVWMATLGIFMIVCFAVGVPVGIFWILFHHHRNMTKYKPVFGFVYLGFKPHLYFWECVIMSRKLLFAICAVIIGPLGSDIQAFCGIAVLLFFLQLQTSLLPYETVWLNRAEMWGLIVRFATLLLGLALDSKNASPAAKTAFGTIIILLNALFITAAALVFANTARVIRRDAMEAIRKDGVLVAMGIKKKPLDRDVEDSSAPPQNSKSGVSKSAVPEAHDLFPSLSPEDKHQVVFRSDRELSLDNMDVGNPIFGMEKKSTIAPLS